MRNLAPDITRQRLLMEGFYTTAIDRGLVGKFLVNIAEHLGLRTYSEPIIHSPSGTGKGENQVIPNSGRKIVIGHVRRHDFGPVEK